MRKKEINERIKVMQAYVDGKQIQRRNGIDWEDVNNPHWDSNAVYRIKPESKYRPFVNVEECWQEMQKHQPFGWLKQKERPIYTVLTYIINYDEGGEHLIIGGKFYCNLQDLFELCTFADGTPFGTK